MRILFLILVVSTALLGCGSNDRAISTTYYDEPFRPQLHFSPKEKWMNDPNGMIYYKGEYHLFYQYHPEGVVWGPMHWGHAVSTDLSHWTHLPIALYPDGLGLIFSGSVVVDKNNTSGFGTRESPPLVAVFTYHSLEKERSGRSDYENQGIAFSVDSGRTWTKYEKNPVLLNQGVKDFRDPKVFWHDETKKWVMILAVKDHVELWGSADLKAWNKLSDFGFDYGGHGSMSDAGVWECPDLFQLPVEGEESRKWVMLVSVNPGGPNGGSATQYFVGEFDGNMFVPEIGKSEISWIDYGPDNYAGVTWSNVEGGRKIFLGWMSNWTYAQDVPTSPWRGAMTGPRDLILSHVNNKLIVKSSIVPEFFAGAEELGIESTLQVDGTVNLSEKAGDLSKSVVKGTFEAKDFTIRLANKSGKNVDIRFDSENGKFVINRAGAGKTDFSKKYFLETNAPRIVTAATINITMVIDFSSVEVFFDDGATVMTSVFFADEPLSDLLFESKEPMVVQNLSAKRLASIWQ